LACFQSGAEQQPLKFLMGDYPPYTYQDNGQNKGIGYEAVAAIMADMQQPFSVKLVPSFGRATVDIKQDAVDGFFLATESAKRNALAEFSYPVLTIQWTWVWLKQRTDLAPESALFKQQAQVSAHSNSNIHQWLQENNYQVTAGTADIRGLLSLLKFKRVDAILLPDLTVKTLMQQQGVDATLYNFQQELNLPFAIYINKSYLKKHPQFMQKLNTAIRRYHNKVNTG
jgi:ABC-type amino acid transport substrate-binding protein